MNWTDLIGLPWRYGADGPDAFDCWGFVRFVQREMFHRELPVVPVPEHWVAVQHLLQTHREHANWHRVLLTEAQDGDLVLMARNRIPVHIGVALRANNTNGVIHCMQPHGVVFQPYANLRTTGWGHLTCYRHNK